MTKLEPVLSLSLGVGVNVYMCKSYEGNYAKAEPSPNPGPAHGRALAKSWPSLAQSLVRPWLGPRQGFARPQASNKRTGVETGEKGVFPSQSPANLEIRFGARLGPGLCKKNKLNAFQRGRHSKLSAPPRPPHHPGIPITPRGMRNAGDNTKGRAVAVVVRKLDQRELLHELPRDDRGLRGTCTLPKASQTG